MSIIDGMLIICKLCLLSICLTVTRFVCITCLYIKIGTAKFSQDKYIWILSKFLIDILLGTFSATMMCSFVSHMLLPIKIYHFCSPPLIHTTFTPWYIWHALITWSFVSIYSVVVSNMFDYDVTFGSTYSVVLNLKLEKSYSKQYKCTNVNSNHTVFMQGYASFFILKLFCRNFRFT